jgi:hypothetical protein
MSFGSILSDVRRFLVGAPPPQPGARLPQDVRDSFEAVHQKITVLHRLTEALQTGNGSKPK